MTRRLWRIPLRRDRRTGRPGRPARLRPSGLRAEDAFGRNSVPVRAGFLTGVGPAFASVRRPGPRRRSRNGSSGSFAGRFPGGAATFRQRSSGFGCELAALPRASRPSSGSPRTRAGRSFECRLGSPESCGSFRRKPRSPQRQSPGRELHVRQPGQRSKSSLLISCTGALTGSSEASGRVTSRARAVGSHHCSRRLAFYLPIRSGANKILWVSRSFH